MATSLTLVQTRSVVAGPSGDIYRVVSTISTSSGIDKYAFVYDYNTETYQHVASAGDYEYPTTRTLGIAYYRRDTATFDSDDVETSVDEAQAVKNSLQTLADDWEVAKDTFVGGETTVITAP